ncbi:pyridoxamine 5'-phosphate oxidase family protein [Kitasatospora sp. RG8]|uniref:pyridoxamine 5'-phosphate oxidase family protein n=1 Tax=Kitasatospora sp. RG8 TaxID=2820815 RepID=UPI001AE0BCD7|nr:pyridoxamine 5'-phosphate oxidase family protein [Kitasatospora sp. RG8]MBP0450609.1 pyridoxamine 5'-phosphate oxidase family protein [Kitasatospora sp. RG8]
MNQNRDIETTRRVDPADVARRITERRDQLGLTDRMLAHRAAMAPRYLEHLMQAGPAFDPGGFLRIAAALQLTYPELVEGRADTPPGRPEAGARPLLLHLTEPECWDKIGTHGVGRIALPVQPGPAVFPVNYTVDAETIVFRTAASGAADPGDGASVSFQVDRIDDHLSQGWSVLILGTAEHVDDPEIVQHLLKLPGTTPWAGGNRPLWVRVRPDEITGRRIGNGGSPTMAGGM